MLRCINGDPVVEGGYYNTMGYGIVCTRNIRVSENSPHWIVDVEILDVHERPSSSREYRWPYTSNGYYYTEGNKDSAGLVSRHIEVKRKNITTGLKQLNDIEAQLRA